MTPSLGPMDFYLKKAKSNKRGPTSQSDPEGDHDAVTKKMCFLINVYIQRGQSKDSEHGYDGGIPDSMRLGVQK